MKFFVDTADIAEISELNDTGLLDGVTTNPSLVAKTGKDFFATVKEICKIVKGPVSAEVTATDHATMLAEGRKLAEIATNIAVKVPLTLDGLKTCKLLSDDGIMVNVTLCFSPAQALLAAKEDAVRAGKTEDDWARDFWLNCSRPPKCLPDVVEAYVGAVFVDSGYNFGEVRAFLERHIRPFFEDMRLYDTFANNHPVTMLAAVMQGQFRCQDWRVLTRELPAGPVAVALDGEDTTSGGEFGEGETRVVCAVRCHGQTLAHAVAESGRYGKAAAAKKALEVLRKMEVEEYRQEFGCTCAGEEGENEEELEAHASAV